VNQKTFLRRGAPIAAALALGAGAGAGVYAGVSNGNEPSATPTATITTALLQPHDTISTLTQLYKDVARRRRHHRDLEHTERRLRPAGRNSQAEGSGFV
jgi:hypothetical protein